MGELGPREEVAKALATVRGEGGDYDNDALSPLRLPAPRDHARAIARPGAPADIARGRRCRAAARAAEQDASQAESHELQSLGEALLELPDDQVAGARPRRNRWSMRSAPRDGSVLTRRGAGRCS